MPSRVGGWLLGAPGAPGIPAKDEGQAHCFPLASQGGRFLPSHVKETQVASAISERDSTQHICSGARTLPPSAARKKVAHVTLAKTRICRDLEV